MSPLPAFPLANPAIPAGTAPDSIEPTQICCEHGILTIRLNRPRVLNAIDLAMAEQLSEHLHQASNNPAIRAVVITGAGRAFCAGGDLKFAHQANPDRPGNSFLALTAILHDCVETIRTMNKPVIAAINGPAVGAGLFLALACDFRVMARPAYLKQSNTSYGLSLPAGGTFNLPRLVGLGQALEIILLDEPIPARKAHRIGLVQRVVSQARLAQATQNLVKRVAAMPVGTIGQVKRLLNESFYSTLTEQLAAERQTIAQVADSSEGREGITAFLQKRQPQYLQS
jgi:2-(1,2-epoxy-1,2-dihydrophenyl)acetyl-CoA isomerase